MKMEKKLNFIQNYDRAQNIFSDLIEQFLQAGIPLPRRQIDRTLYLTRASTRLGSCKKENGIYRISLSVYILKDEKTVRNTLAHELVHTCRGCMNHGANFRRIGHQVENMLGISVNRTASREESEQSGIRDAYRQKVRYEIRCIKCGNSYYRQKKSALVKNPERYRCGKCGGRLYVEEV